MFQGTSKCFKGRLSVLRDVQVFKGRLNCNRAEIFLKFKIIWQIIVLKVRYSKFFEFLAATSKILLQKSLLSGKNVEINLQGKWALKYLIIASSLILLLFQMFDESLSVLLELVHSFYYLHFWKQTVQTHFLLKIKKTFCIIEHINETECNKLLYVFDNLSILWRHEVKEYQWYHQ